MMIAELKAYTLAHLDELEPLREIYRGRTPDAEAVWFKLLETKEEQKLQQFQQMLSEN